MDSIPVDTDREITLPVNTFTKTIYTFLEWVRGNDGSVENADQSTFAMETSDAPLFAKVGVTQTELEWMIAEEEDVTSVDTSGITDMSSLLMDNDTFNQDISGWDVSSVTNHEYFSYESSLRPEYHPSWNDKADATLPYRQRARPIFLLSLSLRFLMRSY